MRARVRVKVRGEGEGEGQRVRVRVRARVRGREWCEGELLLGDVATVVLRLEVRARATVSASRISVRSVGW